MTPFDVSSRECWLLFWEVLAVLATLLVLAGVAEEHVNDHGFWKWPATKDKRREKRGSSILLFGLGLELVSLIFTTVLAGALIADLKLKTGDANARAEEARAAALEAQAKLAWPTLSRAQRRSFVEAVRRFHGQHVRVIAPKREGGPLHFGMAIVDALIKAHWDLGYVRGVGLGEDNDVLHCTHGPGIWVAVDSFLLNDPPHMEPTTDMRAANAAVGAFRSIGFEAHLVQQTPRDDSARSTLVRITVCRRF